MTRPSTNTGLDRGAATKWRWRRIFAVFLAGLVPLVLVPRVSSPAVALELVEASISELQAAMTTGQLTSRDLVETYLARIEAYDQQGPALNAIADIAADALAQADARDAERLAQGPRGPLHGIPIIVKDNYATADMQTAAGSRALAGWIPAADAFLVARLRLAGTIIMAKSNMHEFAYGWESIGSLFGQVRNPYAPARNAGGSSGGTGAAVAANFIVAGMGSDTCGSIRVPAAYNSLVGLRGTQGLLSRSGIVPLSDTQDIGGPMARGVADVAVMLDALIGYDPNDRQTVDSLGHTPETYTAYLDLNGLDGARIGVVTNFVDPAADPEVTAAIAAAHEAMRSQGAELVEVAIPRWDEFFFAPHPYVVIVNEFKFALNAYLAAHGDAPMATLEAILASGKVSRHEAVAPRLQASQDVATLDTVEHYEHLSRRVILRQTILAALAENELDALTYPTVTRKAPVLGERQPSEAITCYLAANSGLPAITVPAGTTSDGFPVGIELAAPLWDEPLLIKLAYAFEQATRHRRSPSTTPPLAVGAE